MAKKRTFSDRGRGDAKRTRLSYGELEQRRRLVEDETRPRTGPSRPRRAKQATRSGPAELHARPRKASRPAMTRKERKGLTGPRLALGAVVLLVVAIPLWIVVFVMPSPIGGLAPARGAFVKTPNVEFKATVPSTVKPQDVTIKVDGKDASANVKVDKKNVSAVVPLSDGKHEAVLQVKTGGLIGTRTTRWSFQVDSTAPKMLITSKKVTQQKNLGQVKVDFKGTVEGSATVKAGDKPVAVDKNGNFQGSSDATRAQSFKISAVDGAGNEADDFIVTQKATAAKGVHVSMFIAASDTDLARMTSLVERTELNALEIDLKDEAGQIGFASDNPLAQQAKAANDWIKLDACVDTMRYKNIYSICRVVCFKDPKLGKLRPDLAVQDKNGGVWSKGVWLDPYAKEVWDYDLSVAEAAAKAGFNEVQFDYVRFPSDGDTSRCVYPHQDARKPVEVIDSFLAYARAKLAPYNVFISADLFGLTASGQKDMGIGQNVNEVAKRVDYISPMVYPSHYNLGEYNIKVPEANPADTVTRSLQDFKKAITGTQAKLRPWLQDFSLKIPYTPAMVRAQIDACQKLGVDQWLLWDPNCKYSEAALKVAK